MKKEVVIIDYGAGNVRSVASALERLDANVFISSDAKDINSAERVIFPGVGHARAAMDFLIEKKLDTVIKNLKQPTLGICLGMQLMANSSQEGDTQALGLIDSVVGRFSTQDNALKIPHMGWNNLAINRHTRLLEGVTENDYFYFVHSYFMLVNDSTTAECGYINPFSAVVERGNFFGCQFHPEKSAVSGEKVLRNFLRSQS